MRKGEVNKSGVSEHVWNNNHNIGWANVFIIDRDSQTISRRIREVIHIRRSSRTSLMNRDEGLELTHMWDLLLNMYIVIFHNLHCQLSCLYLRPSSSSCVVISRH